MKDIYCECGSPVENPDTGLCASCSAAQRKSAKDAIKLTKQQERKKTQRLAGMKEKRTPIKKESDKRADQLALYSILSKKWLKGKRCEVEGCASMATSVHHRKGRNGILLVDTRYFMAVCFFCHNWIHEHPEESFKEGYSLSRTKIQQP